MRAGRITQNIAATQTFGTRGIVHPRRGSNPARQNLGEAIIGGAPRPAAATLWRGPVNPIESWRIASPTYQDALAEQIYQGIVAYRGRTPLQETATANTAARQ
jgi:hypothetical protein